MHYNFFYYVQIQGVISKKLSERYSNKRVRVTGAGRTDQGVHARGQAIHFDVPTFISDVAHFEHSFNRMLPGDVRIFNLTAAPPGNKVQQLAGEPFHAIKSAVGKLYVYRFTTNPFVDPILRNYCTHVYLPVNLDLFQECLSIFQGTHDFRAFGNRVEQSEKDFEDKLYVDYNTVRTINAVHFVDEGRGYYRIEFDIQSAIYKMIRNIVGTSLHVAAGNMPFHALQALLLTSPPRNENIAMPAPPQGLTLEHVYYDHF